MANPVPLTGGAYVAKSLIANAQRCVNLYPETNPEANEPPAPVTHYPRPGLTQVAQGKVGAVRALYTATNGELFACIDDSLYYVAPDWSLTLLGSPLTAGATSPACLFDNETNQEVFVVDDSTGGGWLIDMATHGVSPVVDPSGVFEGSPTITYLDTFTIFCHPKDSGHPHTWYCTESDTYVFNALYFGQKTAWPDPLVTVAVTHREVWLLGTQKTEIWYNAGNPTFPFAIIPGSSIDHGTCARYSVAAADSSVFWLSKDIQGQGMVFQGEGYKAVRISTHAIEAEFNKYATLEDAIGLLILWEGHLWYILTFPTASKTWVYDLASQQWHELTYTDNDGNESRWRGMSHAFAYGHHVIGDYANGKLYVLDGDAYTDAGQPIVFRRGFPHMVAGGKRVYYSQFIADMEVGNYPSSPPDDEPLVYLRWSDTRGKTWGNPMPQGLGATGEYYTQLQWQRLGMARDRVFELFWSAPCKTALNGAFVDPEAEIA